MVKRAHRVVVTGGAGFIGSHLVDRLLAETRAQVVIIDNFSRGRRTNVGHHGGAERLEIVAGDIRDGGLVDRALRGAQVVYHLAAQATVMAAVDDPAYTFTTNVDGTFNVLQAAARHAVAKVLFASSREVYGEPVTLPVHEDAPLMAINSYGASKVAGEAYCRAFARERGLQTAILRFANVYGPRDIGRVVPTWVDQANAGHDLHLYGGTQLIDFVSVGQTVEALWRAAASEVPLPPINVGSGSGTAIADLARRILGLAGRGGQLHLRPARSMEVTRYVANVDRLRGLLHLEPPADPLDQLASLFPPRLAAAA